MRRVSEPESEPEPKPEPEPEPEPEPGCERLLDAAPDLAIDNPQTPTELAGVLERLCERGHLAPAEEWRASIDSLRARG